MVRSSEVVQIVFRLMAGRELGKVMGNALLDALVVLDGLCAGLALKRPLQIPL